MSDPLTLVPLCDDVPDWQPRILLGMVEARSVSVKNITTTTTAGYTAQLGPLSRKQAGEGQGVFEL